MNYLDLNLPNFVTVTIMAAVGIAVLHFIVAFVNKQGISA